MKTKEELNALKEEVETVKGKLAELTEEELKQVSGGAFSSAKVPHKCEKCSKIFFARVGLESDKCPYCDTINTLQ